MAVRAPFSHNIQPVALMLDVTGLWLNENHVVVIAGSPSHILQPIVVQPVVAIHRLYLLAVELFAQISIATVKSQYLNEQLCCRQTVLPPAFHPNLEDSVELFSAGALSPADQYSG